MTNVKLRNRLLYCSKIKQKGFSLMEVLIAIAIFILAILGITIMTQMGYKYYNFIFNQAEILDNIQKSVNTMTKEIRKMRQADSGAFSLEKAESNEIIFYSNVDQTADVERIRYFSDGNCLKRGLTKPAGTPPRYLDANEQINNISCNVTNNPSEPVFAYYNDYPGATSLMTTPADPHLVTVIKIYLRISSTGLQPIPMSKTISGYIRPRNVNKEEDN